MKNAGMTAAAMLSFRTQQEEMTMSHTHEDHDYEVIGTLPSIAMVAAGLLIAVFPALLQLYLLITQ